MTLVILRGTRQPGALEQRMWVVTRVGVLPDKIVTFDRPGAALVGNDDGECLWGGCTEGGENVTGVKALLAAGVPATKAEKRTGGLSNLISSALLRKTNALDPQEAALGTNTESEGRGNSVGGHVKDIIDAASQRGQGKVSIDREGLGCGLMKRGRS